MLKIDPWNILWTVVNLLFLYWVFKKFLFDKVMGVINAREELIKSQFEAAKKEKEAANALKVNYEKKLDDANAEANKIVLEARERAEAEQTKTLERTRDEAEQMLQKARRDIESEKEQAQKAAQADIAKLALLAARKIVKTGDAHDAGSSK